MRLSHFWGIPEHEFNKDPDTSLFDLEKKLGLFKPILDALLLDLSRNRDTEFKGIIQHKCAVAWKTMHQLLEIAEDTPKEPIRPGGPQEDHS